MRIDDNERKQIEAALERELAPEELGVVSDLAQMPESHLGVMEQLFNRNLMAAVFYMRAVAPDIDRSALRRYAHEFDSVISERRKRSGLARQKFYEKEMGRALTVEETQIASSLEGIGAAQRSLLRELARKDRGLALLYLHDLVPSASSQARQLFLEQLPQPK